MQSLLTPKNDYAFKVLFSREPEILVDLINAKGLWMLRRYVRLAATMLRSAGPFNAG